MPCYCNWLLCLYPTDLFTFQRVLRRRVNTVMRLSKFAIVDIFFNYSVTKSKVMPHCASLNFRDNLLVLASGKKNEVYDKINEENCKWSWETWCYLLAGIAAIPIASSIITRTLKISGKYIQKACQMITPRSFWSQIHGRRPIHRICNYSEDYIRSPGNIMNSETTRIIHTLTVGNRDPIDQQHAVKQRSFKK